MTPPILYNLRFNLSHDFPACIPEPTFFAKFRADGWRGTSTADGGGSE